MAEFDFSSYPKPQAPVNPLDQVIKMGQMADTLGQIEVGKAVQGAMDPATGEISRPGVAQALKGSVAGSMKAPAAMQALEQLRTAGFGADQAGLETFQKRMALINHVFGHVAAKDNPTIDDVNSAAARVMDPSVNGPKYGLTMPVVMEALKKFRGPDGRPLPSAKIKQIAADMQTMTMTSSEILSQVAPRFQVIQDGNTIRFEPVPPQLDMDPNGKLPMVTQRVPTGTEYTDENNNRRIVGPQPPAPTLRRNDVFIRPTAGRTGSSNPLDGVVSATPGPVEIMDKNGKVIETRPPGSAFPTFGDRFDAAFGPRQSSSDMSKAPAPGAAEAATSVAQNSANMFNQLTSAANEAPTIHGILQNLEREVEGFTPGPGANWRKLLASSANIVVPDSWKKEGSFLDPKRIADQEGFKKFATELAQRQRQALGGTGTDAQLNSAMDTSPNEAMSKEGIKSVLRILKGNNDALQTKFKEANKFKRDTKDGAAKYEQFLEEFNNNFDPRVFQLKYVPTKERNKWYASMTPEEQERFISSAKYAISKGWIKDNGR